MTSLARVHRHEVIESEAPSPLWLVFTACAALDQSRLRLLDLAVSPSLALSFGAGNYDKVQHFDS